MKYLKQFCVILAFSFVGEILHHFIPLPVPASIYGIVLLFCALEFHLLDESLVADTGVFLIEIMPVMFIPAAVGLLETWDVLQASLLQYVITVLLSTIIVMGVSGVITQKVIERKEKK